MKLHILTTLTALALLSSCNSDEKVLPDENTTALQKLLDDATADNKLPGIILFVKTPQRKIALASGETDLGSHKKMHPSDLSYPQSISKSFTAVAILRLQEQGKLDVDDYMSLYLPSDIYENITNGPDITIRQLLNHTSGIRNYVSNEDFVKAVMDGSIFPMTSEKILTYIEHQPAEFAPGTNFHYSDSNYYLLALIINQVTGKHHGEFFKNEIIDKLGLQHTYYLPYVSDIPATEKTGRWYSFDDPTEQYSDVTEIQFMLTQGGIGDDGLLASAEDLAIFYRALLREKKLLSDASLAEMKKFGQSIEPYGMGLFTITVTGAGDFWGHEGAGLGAGAEAWYSIDEDISVVLMTNTGVLLSLEKQKIFKGLLEKVLLAVVS